MTSQDLNVSSNAGIAEISFTESPVQGITLITLGIAIFSIQDVIIRSIGDTYPGFEIMFIRGLVALVPLGVLVHVSGGFRTLRVAHPWMNLLRGILGLLSYTAYYMGLQAMPIAEATAIFFVSPLLVTFLSALFLNETVGLRRWGAVLLGFVGVLLIVNPDDGFFNPMAILPLLAAAAYSISIIITRKIGKTQSGPSLAFTAMLTFVFFSGLAGVLIGNESLVTESTHPSVSFLLRSWSMPVAEDGALIFLCGLVAAFGFYCLAQGYRVAPASIVAPFEFISMPLAILWGIFLWSEYPSVSTLIGIAMIVGCGIYMLQREATKKRPMTTGRGIRFRL